MTSPEPVRKKQRALKVAIIVCAALFLGGGVIGGVYLATGTQTSTNPTQPDVTPEKVTGTPEVDASYTADSGQLTFTVSNNENRHMEYLIQDNNHKDLVNDFTKQAETVVDVPLASQYRLKVRFVDADDTSYTGPWSKTVTISNDVEGPEEEITLNPAYHDTAWANGEGGLDNLRTALTVAFGANELTLEQSNRGCLQLNYGTVSPGLMIGPEPATIMKHTQLYYSLQQWDDATSTGVITYGWCQN